LKRSKNRIELEKLYLLFSQAQIKYSEEGSQQFLEYEKTGNKPENPCPYFEALLAGKISFNITQESIRETYLTNEWVGLECYKEDWKDNLWVLKYLLSWRSNEKELCWLYSKLQE
jgi:hypothetical protein